MHHGRHSSSSTEIVDSTADTDTIFMHHATLHASHVCEMLCVDVSAAKWDENEHELYVLAFVLVPETTLLRVFRELRGQRCAYNIVEHIQKRRSPCRFYARMHMCLCIHTASVEVYENRSSTGTRHEIWLVHCIKLRYFASQTEGMIETRDEPMEHSSWFKNITTISSYIMNRSQFFGLTSTVAVAADHRIPNASQ